MATCRPRLNSTTPHIEAGQQQDVDLGFEQRLGAAGCVRTAMHPIADHRGSSRLSRQLSVRDGPQSIDCRVDTMTANLHLSPATHVCADVAFRTTRPGLITSWKTDTSDHVVGKSVR